jgi:hypothetical protein
LFSRYQTLAAATEAETKEKNDQRKVSGKRLAVKIHINYFMKPVYTTEKR